MVGSSLQHLSTLAVERHEPIGSVTQRSLAIMLLNKTDWLPTKKLRSCIKVGSMWIRTAATLKGLYRDDAREDKQAQLFPQGYPA